MITRKIALAAAFIFAGTAAFSAISPETQGVIDTFLKEEQAVRAFDRAEVRVGLSQIKIELTSNGQKVEVILNKADGTELKRETEAAGIFDDNTPGVFIRERNRDFLRVDDDSNDDDEDGDDSDDDSSDDDSSDDNSSGGSDDSDDDSNDDNGGDSDGSDDSNDDDSNDDNGSDDNSGGDDNSDNSGSDNGDDD